MNHLVCVCILIIIYFRKSIHTLSGSWLPLQLYLVFCIDDTLWWGVCVCVFVVLQTTCQSQCWWLVFQCATACDTDNYLGVYCGACLQHGVAILVFVCLCTYYLHYLLCCISLYVGVVLCYSLCRRRDGTLLSPWVGSESATHMPCSSGGDGI